MRSAGSALGRRIELDGDFQIRQHHPLERDAHARSAGISSRRAVDQHMALVNDVEDDAELSLIRAVGHEAHASDFDEALEGHLE